MTELKSFFVLLRTFILDFSRDKLGVFFTIIFPLIFLFIFGSFPSDGFEEYRIGIICDSEYVFLKDELEKTGMWKVKIYHKYDDLTDDLLHNKLDAGVNISKGKVEILHNLEDPSKTGMINTLSETIEVLLERKANDAIDFLKVDKNAIKIRKSGVSYSAYLLAGIITISILSNGMFSVIELISDTKIKTIRKFRTTPISPTIFMSAMTSTRFFTTLISSFIFLFIGKSMLGIRYQLDVSLFLILLISSTLISMALGVFFIILFKSAKAAEHFATIFMTIVMFFSGVYFPLSFLPKGLRIFASFIPIKYVAQCFRYVFGAEKMGMNIFWSVNLSFFIFGILFLWLSSRMLFKAK